MDVVIRTYIKKKNSKGLDLVYNMHASEGYEIGNQDRNTQYYTYKNPQISRNNLITNKNMESLGIGSLIL